jgi:hypothetical protein
MALNPRDQSKWDNLQDSGSTTITAILSGKATESEIKALAVLLKEQHDIAGQIFDQGVEDAKRTADTIVDRMNADRVASGKKALSHKAFERVFQSTFQKVMSNSIDDILNTVHDEFQSQSDELSTQMTRALEQMRNIQGPPAPNGQRNLMDRATRTGPPRVTTEEEQRNLMERVLERNRPPDDRDQRSIFTTIKETLGNTRDKITSLYDKFTRRSGDSDEEHRAAIWMRKLKAIFNPVRNAYGKVKSGASKLANLMQMIGKPLMLAVMNPQLIQSITDAVSQYLNFDKISGYVASIWEDTKKVGTDSIDWIIDKVKSFFGLGGSKDKPKQPATEVKKVDPLIQKTATGELPKSISSQQAAQEVPATATKLDAAKQQLSIAQARYKADPSDANKKAVTDAQRNVTFWQTRYTQYTSRAGMSSTAGSDITQAGALVAPSSTGIATPPSTTSTVQAASPSAVLNASSASPTKTEVVADQPVFREGKAYDSPEQQAEAKAVKGNPQTAAAQIGLGSFGFDSLDPSLNVLNIGMFS